MSKQIIDLRSDTITKPTKEMLQAMMDAKVGDDVFGNDPTVNALQNKIAKMFGMEESLFCPSGTMTNQIAMRVNTRPQDEVICHKFSHVYMYEGGGMVYNSMISPKLLNGDRGRITAEQVVQSINPDMMWQFAQYLKKEKGKEGKNVAVYVEAKVSLNGHPKRQLIDSNVDLASVPWEPFKHAEWILTYE